MEKDLNTKNMEESLPWLWVLVSKLMLLYLPIFIPIIGTFIILFTSLLMDSFDFKSEARIVLMPLAGITILLAIYILQPLFVLYYSLYFSYKYERRVKGVAMACCLLLAIYFPFIILPLNLLNIYLFYLASLCFIPLFLWEVYRHGKEALRYTFALLAVLSYYFMALFIYKVSLLDLLLKNYVQTYGNGLYLIPMLFILLQLFMEGWLYFKRKRREIRENEVVAKENLKLELEKSKRILLWIFIVTFGLYGLVFLALWIPGASPILNGLMSFTNSQ